MLHEKFTTQKKDLTNFLRRESNMGRFFLAQRIIEREPDKVSEDCST